MGDDDAPRPLSRRRILFAGGLLASGVRCDTQTPQAGTLGALEHVTERLQRALFNPRRLAPDPGAASVTPDAAFPIYKVAPEVPLAPEGWTLNVTGLVARPTRFTLAELMRLPRSDLRVRHHCVEGWTAVASWHGVALRDLASVVGADPRVPYVAFRSFDRDPDGVLYGCSWDRESALHAQTLLAYGKNGQPLTPAYGAPLRLYGAVKLGYKMVKYLTEVSFVAERGGGYWENLGYEWWAGV